MIVSRYCLHFFGLPLFIHFKKHRNDFFGQPYKKEKVV